LESSIFFLRSSAFLPIASRKASKRLAFLSVSCFFSISGLGSSFVLSAVGAAPAPPAAAAAKA